MDSSTDLDAAPVNCSMSKQTSRQTDRQTERQTRPDEACSSVEGTGVRVKGVGGYIESKAIPAAARCTQKGWRKKEGSHT